MSAAAGSVGLSQPALTQGLAKLERRLGAVLFDRRSGGMCATIEGTIIVERIDAAFGFLAAACSGSRRFRRAEHLMTATQLKAFLALADAGSFVTAGQTIGLSQPAVHRSVRDLEAATGQALLERRGRGVALTAAGRRLARGIRLVRAELMAAIVEARPSDGNGRIVIGAMPLSRALLVPTAVARLVADMPQVSLSILEGSRRELIEPLRDGVIDLMIGALRREVPNDLVQTALLDDHPVVVAGSRHPLAGSASVTVDQLAGYPWIVGHDGSPLRAHWEWLFAGNRSARKPIECGSVMVIRGLLAAGDFLTLLSPAQVRLEVTSGLLSHIAASLPESPRTIGITTRAGWRPTSAQKHFVELLKQAADEP